MRQFFEAYCADEKVTALLTELPWTHNLIILTQSKRPEEREFYLRMKAGGARLAGHVLRLLDVSVRARR